MSYPDPHTVNTPKDRWENKKVIYDGGEGEWSAAIGNFDNRDVLALRWNGHEEDPNGYPKAAFGHPCWFIVPDDLKDVIQASIELMVKSKKAPNR